MSQVARLSTAKTVASTALPVMDGLAFSYDAVSVTSPSNMTIKSGYKTAPKETVTNGERTFTVLKCNGMYVYVRIYVFLHLCNIMFHSNTTIT